MTWRGSNLGEVVRQGMAFFRLQGSRVSVRAMSLAATIVFALIGSGIQGALAGSGEPANLMLEKLKAGVQDDGAPATSNWANAAAGGKSTTETRIVNDGSAAPFLTADSLAAMKSAESHYAAIAAAGGWGTVGSGRFKKGDQSKSIAAINHRLFLEGYLREEATQGDFANTFTTATEDAVSRFQTNHGLAVSGSVDNATVKELNVPVERRLAAIRANLPRLEEYSKDLGPRYVVVNVPAQQIEAIDNGRVYSIHNAIVGRPSRPTPVVMTNLVTVRFNPYWNAPPSIVERDLVPRMLSSGASSVMKEMNMKVFQGVVGGTEINPDTVNWRRAVVDNYHFRQEPGGSNAMATAKIEFNSPFGIYLHDTPEPRLFETGQRFYSSGCVRVQKVAILLNWILNGQDNIGNARIAELAQTKERLDVTISNPPQIRVAYLTAWPTGNGVAAFRPDIYELDGTGFVLGQPLPVGETDGGLRYVLKPVVRTVAAVEADEATGGFFNNLFGAHPSEKMARDQGVFAARSDSLATPKSKLKLAKSAKGNHGAFNWLSAKNDPAAPSAKLVKGKKIVIAKADAAAKTKKIVKKVTLTASAQKLADAKTAGPAGAKTGTLKKAAPAAVKPSSADQCKPDKDGKLAKGCKLTSATVKAKVKPATATAAAN